MGALDFVEPYLRTTLDFIGLRNITAYRVEGSALSARKEQAMAVALKKLNDID